MSFTNRRTDILFPFKSWWSHFDGLLSQKRQCSLSTETPMTSPHRREVLRVYYYKEPTMYSLRRINWIFSQQNQSLRAESLFSQKSQLSITEKPIVSSHRGADGLFSRERRKYRRYQSWRYGLIKHMKVSSDWRAEDFVSGKNWIPHLIGDSNRRGECLF